MCKEQGDEDEPCHDGSSDGGLIFEEIHLRVKHFQLRILKRQRLLNELLGSREQCCEILRRRRRWRRRRLLLLLWRLLLRLLRGRRRRFAAINVRHSGRNRNHPVRLMLLLWMLLLLVALRHPHWYHVDLHGSTGEAQRKKLKRAAAAAATNYAQSRSITPKTHPFERRGGRKRGKKIPRFECGRNGRGEGRRKGMNWRRPSSSSLLSHFSSFSHDGQSLLSPSLPRLPQPGAM